MRHLIITILLFYTTTLIAQKEYPKNYFRNPLDIPIVLAGTFGELRSNHFHAGMDIKTQRKVGLNVYAAADGYVSRIKVALWGYGKAIYVTHPNGYTTVYAHLQKFGKGIETYVKNIQYQKKSYETGNIFFKEGEIPVKKGQVIAYSGRTGGFVAPHLHFEIRDTKTSKIINPMHFGIHVKDTILPTIKDVFVYPLSDSSRINNSVNKSLLAFKKINNNTYTTNRISAKGPIGFGIQVFDRLNGAKNKNGIYSLQMKVNGHLVYHHNLETFSFAESKYINLLIDYKSYARFKHRFQKTFREKANKLKIYKSLINDGLINIKEGYNYKVEIIAADFAGNKTTVRIPAKGVKSNQVFSAAKDTTAYKITASQFHKFQQKNVTIAFPKHTFYKDLYLDFKVEDGIAFVHKPTVPLNKSYTLTFDVSTYTAQQKEQLYIANINNKKYPSYQNTRKKKTTFFTTTKTLGKYTLLSDTKKPKVYLKNFKDGQWISKHSKIIVTISDTESGIKSYTATLDGEWILMEYDLKKRQLVYDFNDKKLVGAKHLLEITVEDNVGNTNTLNATFYKKQ
ncbi:MAG: M23 family metallopeptidase [Flavobacteriaceae bacterium]|nr:M23 family metallopeptidase [Flavobacteriaceae bacterium]